MLTNAICGHCCIVSNSEDDRATHFLVRLLPSLKPVGTIRAVTVNSPTLPPTTKAPSATISLPLTHGPKVSAVPESVSSPDTRNAITPEIN